MWKNGENDLVGDGKRFVWAESVFKEISGFWEEGIFGVFGLDFFGSDCVGEFFIGAGVVFGISG